MAEQLPTVLLVGDKYSKTWAREAEAAIKQSNLQLDAVYDNYTVAYSHIPRGVSALVMTAFWKPKVKTSVLAPSIIAEARAHGIPVGMVADAFDLSVAPIPTAAEGSHDIVIPKTPFNEIASCLTSWFGGLSLQARRRSSVVVSPVVLHDDQIAAGHEVGQVGVEL